MSHDMSFLALFMQASLLVKLVMLTLVMFSIVSWALIFQRGKIIGNATNTSIEFEDRFWSGIDLSRLYAELSSQHNNGIALMFVSGFKEFSRLRQNPNVNPEAVTEASSRAMRVALSREIDELEQHLPFLATVGSISPYIGLFGTVWGIMNAFIALGEVQQATLTMVAPGIAEALIATAMGLFAAIPAVMAYNRFSTKVEKLENTYVNFMDEFSSILHRQSHLRDER